ncbi:MAG: peptidylprolyl isomerase [Planctomycetes bacterium ADurb.Bin412]|nr:MAG: peptidylprolyl isomerase [Planctomycetes bacterium ADurb.Bin412]
MLQVRHLLVLTGLVWSGVSFSYAQVSSETVISTDPNVLAADSHTVPGAVLRINNDALTSAQVITQPELRANLQQWAGELNRQQFLARAEMAVAKEVRDQIFDLLLYQHAIKDLEKHDDFEKVIEKELAEARKRLIGSYNGIEAQAQEELAKKGSSLEKELETIKRRMVVQSYRETYFMPTQDITRGQMMQYYRRHLEDQFQQKAEIQFQMIEILAARFLDETERTSPSAEQKAAAKEKARQAAAEAWAKLQSGTDFAEVVKEYSQGFRKDSDGLWRPIQPDALQDQYKPVAEALAGRAAGELSGILEGEDRFFIAKLVSYQEARTIPFSEAQYTIAEEIRKEQWTRHIGKLYMDLLAKATLGDIEKFVRESCISAYDLLKVQKK